MDPKFIFYQATLWQTFAKVIPLIITIVVAILYAVGFRDWPLIIDSLLSLAFIFFVTWWFWVIWTIMLIASVLEKSKVNFQDIIQEVKSFKENIKDLKN